MFGEKSMRHKAVWSVCAAAGVCSSILGASWVDVPVPSIDTICRQEVVTKDWSPERGPRGHRGHRGKKGKRGDKGDSALLSPAFSEGVFVLSEGGGPVPVLISGMSPYPDIPYVVPLVSSAADQQIAFDPSTNSFEILASGTYLAEYFLKVVAHVSTYVGNPDSAGYVVIALQDIISGNQFGVTKLVPNQMGTMDPAYPEGYNTDASGTYQELLQLTRGMQLQLVILELPTTVSPPNNYIPFDFIGGDPLQPFSDEVAYLTLLKVT